MLIRYPQYPRKLEYVFLFTGVLLVSTFTGRWIASHSKSQRALRTFAERERVSDTHNQGSKNPLPVDFTLWSPGRVKAYRESLKSDTNAPIAVLEIDKIHLRVPVLTGTSDIGLSGGAGWIEGTARPGSDGNVAIASHRDGFFRGLKDVNINDEVKLVTHGEINFYVVDYIDVVNPTDVRVLKPGKRSMITLVTNYPFYYIGSAPKRYTVHGLHVARQSPARTTISLRLELRDSL